MLKSLSKQLKFIRQNSTHSVKLTTADIETFKRVGFVKSSTFFSEEEKKNLVEWTNEIQKWNEVKEKYLIYYEKLNGKDLLCRIENFVPYHQNLSNLFLKKITDACSFLMEEECILYKDKINFKLQNGSKKIFFLTFSFRRVRTSSRCSCLPPLGKKETTFCHDCSRQSNSRIRLLRIC
jgi:hypothetical protein